jgi:hypothetical protein
MTRTILLALLGITLTGFAAREFITRRQAETRYQHALAEQRRLELRVGEIFATHEQLKLELDTERQRARDLTDALASTRAELEQAVGRLAEETMENRTLNLRLAAMERQMGQMQGELAVALDGGPAPEGAKGRGAVQLERIVVNNESQTALRGRVLSIHNDWNFVVIDLGWDAVRIGDVVSIFRNDELLAKAKVERVQEGICAATILPQWKAETLKVNDSVRIL